MHSIDTVKTRQQAAPHMQKYGSVGRAYWTIFREEGIRGLYGGSLPMLLGSSEQPSSPLSLTIKFPDKLYFSEVMNIRKRD